MSDGDGCLIDSNILLRISEIDDPLYGTINHALHVPVAPCAFAANFALLLFVFFLVEQTIVFVVCSAPQLSGRPPKTSSRHDRWRSLVVVHNVEGGQVHGVPRMLSLNVRDFKRLAGLRIIHPEDLR